jgi:hypothetical protein
MTDTDGTHALAKAFGSLDRTFIFGDLQGIDQSPCSAPSTISCGVTRSSGMRPSKVERLEQIGSDVSAPPADSAFRGKCSLGHHHLRLSSPLGLPLSVAQLPPAT